MNIRRTRMRIKAAMMHGPYSVADAFRNRQCRGSDRRFLILRHSAKNPHFHDYLLDWMKSELPAIRALFEQRLLPFSRVDWSRYAVCAPWLQDPAEDWLPRGSWKRIQNLEQQCAELGIPLINPPSNLSNATKSKGALIMTELGVRVPRTIAIADPESFLRDHQQLKFPLIIREDRKHSAPTFLVENRRQLREIPWNRFSCPVAAEYINVQSPDDGLYRKYRYVAARDYGVPRHLIVSRHWEVRAEQREHNQFTKKEEIEYLDQSDVNHNVLQQVRKALQLDLVAIDYSYTPDGQLVVWEANAYPNLSYPTGTDTEYTTPYVVRSFAAITAMYLTAGKYELPPYLLELLGNCAPMNMKVEAA